MRNVCVWPLECIKRKRTYKTEYKNKIAKMKIVQMYEYLLLRERFYFSFSDADYHSYAAQKKRKKLVMFNWSYLTFTFEFFFSTKKKKWKSYLAADEKELNESKINIDKPQIQNSIQNAVCSSEQQRYCCEEEIEHVWFCVLFAHTTYIEQITIN